VNTTTNNKWSLAVFETGAFVLTKIPRFSRKFRQNTTAPPIMHNISKQINKCVMLTVVAESYNFQQSNNNVEKAPPKRRKEVQKEKPPRARYEMQK
jgi:hypothetical protein